MLGKILSGKKNSAGIKRKQMQGHMKRAKGKPMILPRGGMPKPGRDLGKLMSGLKQSLSL
jgi:hypothetical protein